MISEVYRLREIKKQKPTCSGPSSLRGSKPINTLAYTPSVVETTTGLQMRDACPREIGRFGDGRGPCIHVDGES